MERDPIQDFSDLWSRCNISQRRLITELVNNPSSWRGRTPPCPYQEILKLYESCLPSLRRVKILTPRRKGRIKALWQQMPDVIEWRAYFQAVAQNPFLMGQVIDRSGRTWQADLDWLCNIENFAKVIEGKYR